MIAKDPYQFQHTLKELRECYDALRFNGMAELDREETEAMEELIQTCGNFLDIFGIRVDPSEVQEALAQIK